ncbi:MAG: hypothetical protein AMXMBFR81_17490 [Chthonomonas sp.]|nr:hypothetical protein [Fimbriimonadaceae bacterium]
MYVTQGDVIAVIAGILLWTVSGWCLVVGAATLFRDKTRRARDAAESAPWRTLLSGAAIVAIGVFLGAVLSNIPNGLTRLLGFSAFLGLLALGLLGAAGIATLVGERLRHLDANLSPYAALSRGTVVLVVGCLFPLLGWLVFAPILLFVSVGAGVRALWVHRTARQPSVA